jgi:HSP20 family protein
MALVPLKKTEEQGTLMTLKDEMNRVFDNFWRGDFLPEGFPLTRAFPSIEVSETEDKVIVRAEVPGMEAKDIELSLVGDRLEIKGEKKEEKEQNEKGYYAREVRYGTFQRSIQLPATVNVDKVQAECRKGVLKITLAKKEDQKSRKIVVKGE